MTAVSAFSAARRGSRNPGKYEPFLILGVGSIAPNQLDRPGPGLPIAIAVAVAMDQSFRRALAMPGPGQTLYLQLHQAPGGKADHLAQQRGVRALLQKPAEGHPVVGHRGGLR
jgi:hypothetical protein